MRDFVPVLRLLGDMTEIYRSPAFGWRNSDRLNLRGQKCPKCGTCYYPAVGICSVCSWELYEGGVSAMPSALESQPSPEEKPLVPPAQPTEIVIFEQSVSQEKSA